jgi:hypothetical protein
VPTADWSNGWAPGPAAAVHWIARSPARAFLVIFLAAFCVGTAVLPFVPPIVIEPHTRWESNAVAVSLATKGTFADPYALPTGPTAHMPPAFPALLALLYVVFGLNTTAGHVAYLVLVAAGAVMVAMLPWLSERFGAGREPGVVGGLAGALVPRMPYQVEYFAAIALGLLVAWHLSRWQGDRGSSAAALLLGLAWGAACHVTPSLLPVMIGCLAFDVWWMRGRRRWAQAAVTVLGLALACLPWTWRNLATFGEMFFIRSDFGLELRMGNHDGAVADIDVLDVPGGTLRHPRTHLAEARLVQELGEAAYMRGARSEALEWIRNHPGRFARLSAQRVFHFWFGSPSQGALAVATAVLSVLALLGLWRAWPALGPPQRAAFVVPLAAFPLVYYLVLFMPRYSVPLEGILLVLAGVEAWRRGRTGST